MAKTADFDSAYREFDSPWGFIYGLIVQWKVPLATNQMMGVRFSLSLQRGRIPTAEEAGLDPVQCEFESLRPHKVSIISLTGTPDVSIFMPCLE